MFVVVHNKLHYALVLQGFVTPPPAALSDSDVEDLSQDVFSEGSSISSISSPLGTYKSDDSLDEKV
jgi:hypothetical protein